MSSLRFVHCADLHLDTPCRGLSDVTPEVGAVLNGATFHSFENIVSLAIEEHVDFVVIAGDVYDSKDRSLRAQLRFRDGLRRLADNCIPSFIALGNHDPLNGWSNTLEWPEQIHVFGGTIDSLQVTRGDEPVATVHGISFPKAEVKDDLASRFKAPEGVLPSIAVLHCNVGSNTGHEPYAPTTVEELSSTGFTYWALGHVHAYRILKAGGPAIVYPGCSQSRHPNETGEKGCCLVTLSEGRDPDIQFRATDTVRFFRLQVDLSRCSSIDDIRQEVLDSCDSAASSADGRYAVVRLMLTGRTALQRELARGETVSELCEAIRADLMARDPWVWVESFTSQVRSTYDVDELRQQEDFAGDIVRAYSGVLDADPDRFAGLRSEMQREVRSSNIGKLVSDVSPEEFTQLVENAVHRTLDKVLEED